MVMLTPLDPDWKPPFCSCNQPGVAYHPLGHEAFCRRPRWRVAVGRASNRAWQWLLAAYWRRAYRRWSRGGGLTRLPRTPR